MSEITVLIVPKGQKRIDTMKSTYCHNSNSVDLLIKV